jgi:hypothetical protein
MNYSPGIVSSAPHCFCVSLGARNAAPRRGREREREPEPRKRSPSDDFSSGSPEPRERLRPTWFDVTPEMVAQGLGGRSEDKVRCRCYVHFPRLPCIECSPSRLARLTPSSMLQTNYLFSLLLSGGLSGVCTGTAVQLHDRTSIARPFEIICSSNQEPVGFRRAMQVIMLGVFVVSVGMATLSPEACASLSRVRSLLVY